MEVIKMRPVFKQYIWGGDNLNKVYDKDTPEAPVAESWEISAHPDGLSTAFGGEYNGLTIPELCDKLGEAFYGKSIKKGEEFPLLLKILDANDRLSVQVHPNDEYAYKNENKGRGKTEAWYILSAEKGAKLIYGFKDDISRDDFKKAIDENRTEDILNFVECFEGDVFYIPAGTVHAVGKGLMIAEIQQSSNTTYRVYDYNRRGADGKLRELHIEKALDVSNTKSSKGLEKTSGTVEKFENTTITTFTDNEFFHFDKLEIDGRFQAQTNDLLHLLLVIEGNIKINGVSFKKGESAIVPAGTQKYIFEGTGTVLRYF